MAMRRWGSRGAWWVCAVVGCLALGACEPGPWEEPAGATHGEAPLGTLLQEASSTLTFVAAADTTALAAEPTRNLGSATLVRVDQSPDEEAYLRFNVTGVSGTVTRAVLRLYAVNGSSAGPALYPTATGWSEGGLTWNTRPARTGASLGTRNPAAGAFVEYDVTALVKRNGDFGFGLVPTSTDGADFASREDSTASRRPQLVLTVQPATPPPTSGEVQLLPTADVMAREAYPTQNFGAATTLSADDAPRETSYLRFDVQGVMGSVTRARLRLYVTNGTSDGPLVHMASSGWNEGQVTWNTRPFMSGEGISSLASFTVGTWVEYDVTELVQGNGEVNFGLRPISTDGAGFASREDSTAARRPRLIVTYQGGGEVRRAFAYDHGFEGNGAFAYDREGRTLLLSWSGTSEFTLERRTRDNGFVWARRFIVTPIDEGSGDLAGGVVYAADFAPDGSAWAILKWRNGTVDLGQGPLASGDYLVKFGGNGSVLWYRGFWSPSGTAFLADLDVDRSGRVALTGNFYSGADFGAGPVGTVPPSSSMSGFVAHYGPTGALRWVRAFGNTELGLSSDVATGEDGTVLVCGSHRGTGPGTFAGTPIVSNHDASMGEGVLARLTAEGSVQWAKGVGGSLLYCALSRLGTAVAAGAGNTVDWAGQVHENNGTFLITAEINGAGRWVHTNAGQIYSLGVDDAGSARVLLGGRDFTGAYPPQDNLYFAVERINLDGNHRWTQWLGLLHEDLETAVRPHLALSPEGEGWVYGSFWGTQPFGTFTLTAAQGADNVLLRLAP
jgi:hypothetical protein